MGSTAAPPSGSTQSFSHGGGDLAALPSRVEITDARYGLWVVRRRVNITPPTIVMEFDHEHYFLDQSSGVLSRKPEHVAPRSAEEKNAESSSVLEALTTHVQVSIECEIDDDRIG